MLRLFSFCYKVRERIFSLLIIPGRVSVIELISVINNPAVCLFVFFFSRLPFINNMN